MIIGAPEYVFIFSINNKVTLPEKNTGSDSCNREQSDIGQWVCKSQHKKQKTKEKVMKMKRRKLK